MKKNPIHPLDDEARQITEKLLSQSKYASIAVMNGTRPHIARIGIGRAPDGAPLALLSDLATHTALLRQNPACALLLGSPGLKGDALTQPRLSLDAQAEFVERTEALREAWLEQHPKAKIYVDFADFHFARFRPEGALLNAGFGKAYRLSPNDLP